MAKGIQKKIEYADLQFISAFAMEKILDFQTWEIPGEHARGNFRLLLSENETGINGMNAFDENELLEDEVYKQILAGKLQINEGMLYENAIAQMLVANGNRFYHFQ